MLTIPISTVAWIIVKAREFDAKDLGSDAGDDDNPLGVLADRDDDPTVDELTSWISDLTDTEKAELVALFWLGRDSGDAADLPDLIAEARRNQNKSTSKYLLGSPMLGDYLEEGLEILGYDTSEIESSIA
ncbi:MAG: DUF3775 domain-containing protein [Thermohalobaculum sp.]|nr:DUF3775 domain-containing protein [Thermohalobaculum sp.]